jgi:hypothetical protein
MSENTSNVMHIMHIILYYSNTVDNLDFSTYTCTHVSWCTSYMKLHMYVMYHMYVCTYTVYIYMYVVRVVVNCKVNDFLW